MSVTIDSVGTHQHKTTATSFTYSGLTIGAGLTNSVAVFAVSVNSAGGLTFTVPQWNGVTCTQIGTVSNGNNNGQVVWFGIVNPASGNHNFTVTQSVSHPVNIGGWSFSGADQTGSTTTFAHFASNSNNNATSSAATITTVSGNYTLAACNVGTGSGPSGTLTNGASVSEDWEDSTDVAGVGGLGAAGHVASTGTSLVWTAHNSSADFLAIAGFDIAAAVAGDTFGNNMVRLMM